MSPKYVEIGYKSDLMQACSAGNLDRVRELFAENPAFLWQVCDTGVAIVQLLLEYGADKNMKDNDGKTPVELTESKTIRKLLEA